MKKFNFFGLRNKNNKSQNDKKETSVNSYISQNNKTYKINGEITENDIPDLIKIGARNKMAKRQHVVNDPTDLYPLDDPKNINEFEKIFFNKLFDIIQRNNVPPYFYSERLSDGTINVWNRDYYVGKVRLTGRKHKFQISTDDVKYLEAAPPDSIILFVDNLNYWEKIIIKNESR